MKQTQKKCNVINLFERKPNQNQNPKNRQLDLYKALREIIFSEEDLQNDFMVFVFISNIMFLLVETRVCVVEESIVLEITRQYKTQPNYFGEREANFFVNSSLQSKIFQIKKELKKVTPKDQEFALEMLMILFGILRLSGKY